MFTVREVVLVIHKALFTVLIVIRLVVCLIPAMDICHEDLEAPPPDGLLKPDMYPWLAIIRYEHVTTAEPYRSKSPRVVMIHKQFVLGTAKDVTAIPKNYKLSKVIFGDYVRDEEECELSKLQMKMGVTCSRAYLEIPIRDVTSHPEYSRFGVGNSLAVVKLVRPVTSHYMLPICLPSLKERFRKKNYKMVFLIDYVDPSPMRFETEKKAKKSLKLYTHSQCRSHRLKEGFGSEGVSQVLCSSGCGVRPGAPVITQTPSGSYELIGLSAASPPCRTRRMRNRLNPEPPLYIDVFPFITWITNIINAHILPKPYPQHFQLTSAGTVQYTRKGQCLRKRRSQKHGWIGRMYGSGNLCFKSQAQQRRAAQFYTEIFEVNTERAAKVNIYMKFSAGVETTIVCARILLPNRQVIPTINGVGGYNISIELSTDWFPYRFFYSVSLFGKNTTSKDFTEWLPERSSGFY